MLLTVYFLYQKSAKTAHITRKIILRTMLTNEKIKTAVLKLEIFSAKASATSKYVPAVIPKLLTVTLSGIENKVAIIVRKAKIIPPLYILREIIQGAGNKKAAQFHDALFSLLRVANFGI